MRNKFLIALLLVVMVVAAYSIRVSTTKVTVENDAQDTIVVPQIAGIVRPVPSEDSATDLTLRVGDTSINTESGGRFIFTNVAVETGIALTHPELTHAFIVTGEQLTQPGLLEIPFSVNLYTTIESVLNMPLSKPIEIVATTYGRYTSPVAEQHIPEVYSFAIQNENKTVWYRFVLRADQTWQRVE